MSGGKNKKNGYTIVEVLMFLTISSFMFVVAAGFINHRQANAEFQQGMTSTQTLLSKVMSDTANGNYPTTPFSCSAAGSNLNFTPAAGSQEQGEKQDCVFLGKAIFFGTQDAEDTDYTIQTIAARRFIGAAADNKSPATLAQATPARIDRPGVAETGEYEWNLGLIKATAAGMGNIMGVAFINSYGINARAGQVNENGTQSLTAVPIPVPTGASDFANMSDDLKNAQISAGVLQASINMQLSGQPPNVSLCFEANSDEQSSRYGVLKFGDGNGQRLSSRYTLYNSLSEAQAQGNC